MFKLNKKSIALASIATIATIFTGCIGDATPKEEKTVAHKADISGGVNYPIVGDHTGPYKVNPQIIGLKINNGRTPTPNELKAWNVDIMPDGTGLPEGEGSVEEGEAIYEEKCQVCHGDFGSGGGGYPALAKGNAYELHKTLTNQRNLPDKDGPVRVFGSYWPQASTLWWYIRDAMPHTKSKTLSNDEVYALVAYILNLNEMEIDGEEVDDEYVLNREKFLKIKMPNRDGFEPKIDGPNGLENVRKYYANPHNYGAKKVNPSERCMTDCQRKTAKVVHIQNGGISEFNPPLSVKRDLPKQENDPAYKVTFDAQKAYKENCTMCHGAVAPAAGDKDAWAPILAKGRDKVYANGLSGTDRGMPARGGSSLSDKEFKSVVDYMLTFK
ncbi:membrane c-type cytochrome cy [hydrothermal vent metagenome]|uniref:Membrane c-type cytochrome cy n=1 Tax=hydrothermal vent metagenome TaxID=652676 RepID=A0A1W1D425_9ZZZZ